jgi:hypothetical protein
MNNVWHHIRNLLPTVIPLALVACGPNDLEPAPANIESLALQPEQGSSVAMPDELRTAFLETLQHEGQPADLFAYTSVLESNLVASSGQSNEEFGIAVAIDEDLAVIGVHQDDTNGADAGACYVFSRNGLTWTQDTKITAPDGAAGDAFGTSVAINGTTILVGAPGADPMGKVDCGAAYVFLKDGTMAPYQVKLQTIDGMAGDRFGHSVAVSTSYAVVGAIGNDSQATNAGAVYSFVRLSTMWGPAQKITASDGGAGDQFGQSVGISNNAVCVGASLADVAGRSDQGAVYVFTQAPINTWIQQAKLTATDGQADDQFGHSLSFGNSNLAVGAPFDDDPTKGIDSGSMYVFLRMASVWSQSAKITANDGAAGDQFGTSVVLTEGPSTTAMAGAPKDDDMGTDSGSMYVFQLDSMMTWNQRIKIVATNGAAQDEFGTSIAFSGTTAIAGAFGNDVGTNANQGSAYVYRIGKTNADPCVVGKECLSGYCVDDLCCDTACTGTCQACTNARKGFGADGVCGSIVYGKVPDNPNECPTDFTNSPCGLDGTCDGAGQCRKVVPGTSCPGVSTCMNGKAIAPICNGLGACVDDVAVACAPYVCNANGTMCTTSCLNNAGCSIGNYCDNGVCAEKIEIGLACAANPQCKSGFCVDGVCCSTPCNGPCQVCTSALQGGAGVDGYCGNAQEGTNPGNRCMTQDPTTCGMNGMCSAGGVCQFYSYDTPCGTPACESNSVISKFCNGSGTCLTESEPCGNYLCSGATCNKTCSSAADCVEGAHCNAGECTTDASLGAPCIDDTGCASGHCVESTTDSATKVCCSSACASSGDPCGFTGRCNTFGACELPAYGATCGVALCTGGLKYGGQICNGLGACVPDPNTVESCFPYLCDGSDACKTACVDYGADSMESDCVPGFRCGSGQCIAITKTCVTVDDCESGEVCDAEKNTCVTRPVDPPSEPPSCDCRIPGHSSNRAGLPSAFALALLILARRRRPTSKRTLPH